MIFLLLTVAVKCTFAAHSYLYSDFPSDLFQEYFNVLDGDSIGIGPMHEFVFGWQSIASKMSMKNNVETRKRAGLQRFALAGINGITFIEHRGVNQIMINGTRTYCFGDAVRPPVSRRSVLCNGLMYQDNRYTCDTPFLRFTTINGYRHCISKYAVVICPTNYSGIAYCAKGEDVDKFHHEYICQRQSLRVFHINNTDFHERHNIRNPAVRRVEYYRDPNDFLKKCSDWYGCDIDIRPGNVPGRYVTRLSVDKSWTNYIATGGPFWHKLMHSQLTDWAPYFQPHADYPWNSYRPVTDKNWIQSIISFLSIQSAKSNMHYNLQGIGPRGHILLTDYMKEDPEVFPENMQQNFDDSLEKFADKDHTDYEPLHLYKKFNQKSRFNPNYASIKKK